MAVLRPNTASNTTETYTKHQTHTNQHQGGCHLPPRRPNRAGRGARLSFIRCVFTLVSGKQQQPSASPTGTPLAEYTTATIEGILAGHEEVAHGFSVNTSRASRDQLDGMFKGMLFAM